MASKDNKPAKTPVNQPKADLGDRLERLKSRLDDPDVVNNSKPDDYDSEQSVHNRAGVAQAFRLSSEFIAGIVVGAGIGYLIDTFFGTSPWGLIIFFLLGFCVAVLNVMRAAGMVAESNMRLKPAHELHKKQHEAETSKTPKK